MLVNHLRHSVAKQNHILVKRLNLTLQFYPVNKVDGNRNMFSTQGVEKRVLK